MLALAVDDNRVIRRIHKMLLTKLGVNSLDVENGKQAVDLFLAGGKFDIVLMDREMPVMDGIESIQEDTYTNIIFRYGGFWKMVKGSDRREEYDTLANEHDMIAMFNMHQGSPNIEIFITIEHDVHPTPDDRGFQSDEMFGVESQNDGFVDPMEALSSFLDGEENGVDYAVFYDSEEEQYTVVDYLNQNKRRHSVSIEELDDDDAPFIPPTTIHEVPISPAVTSDQPFNEKTSWETQKTRRNRERERDW
ncbi:hypothetical protein QJS10_CPA10g01555 [Acorus calamus]|uniref:Response regulatory domain-containing protein n=1 Tax=Acorus calamus TaxID=4465 RepID=A0AAV9DWJ6_ACOCL|nr:hypothetical protein QJS10_CPA10g01555 [Acorus calamus]